MKNDIMELFSDTYNEGFKNLKNKTILITGASGLLGSHLLSSIKKKQKEFNIKIYTWNKTQHTLFKELFNDCETIYGDMTIGKDYDFLPSFDFIIHSAGYGQPSKFLENKIKTIEINSSVTLKLLNKLKPDGTFLFISSSEVYNGLFEYNITEDKIGLTDLTHPRSSYIEGKKCGEVICNIFKENGRNIKIARLGITYGPGTQKGDTRVINSLIDKGLRNNIIELLDDGSSLRGFCYISDAIEMIWNILFKGGSFIYNVSGVETITILDLAKIIGSNLNKNVKISKIKGLAGSPKLVNLSIDRYLKEFNKTDFVRLEEGIKSTIAWQKGLNEEY